MALLLAAAAALPAPEPPPQFVEAVEFPYYLYPRQLWERELVWLKNIGVRTVEFSIPWNWHQIGAGDYDFTGRTSPRRDLAGFIRLLRRLDLRAWVRPLPPVAGWRNEGVPLSANEERVWRQELSQLFATQTASHGGPVAYVEGRGFSIDAPSPPKQVTVISAMEPGGFARSRDVIVAAASRSAKALLWTDVEDALYPGGWSTSLTLIRKGAVGLSGDEHPATGGVRRDAALLRNWLPLLAKLEDVEMPKPLASKLPQGVTARELVSRTASAVSITNRGDETFHDDLRVTEPGTKHAEVIPGVTVRSGDSLWLPLAVSLGPGGICAECTEFAGAEHVVYATAELLSIEFENGILALEFAAPQPAEVVLQLARKPIGPFLAAGHPTEFDWDDKLLRARMKIPAGSGLGNRVRIGIAIEEPETSAFFNESRRLIIGRKNVLSTTYSSAEVANRSRLRVPEGYTANKIIKSPNEIDYEVTVPPEAVHGDYANLALEADGVPLGRAHLQLFRPATIRVMEAMQLHFGSQTELTPDPPIVPIEPKAGANIEISIRNHDPGIQTFRLEAAGDGLEFFPPKTEISIAGTEERRVSLRIFAKADDAVGLRDWRLKVSGGYTADLPMRALLIPRGRTVVWSADLDGDGSPEWVLETQRVRSIFSSQDGGRWLEFNWKDANVNFLPEQGAFASPGPVDAHVSGDALDLLGQGWKRTIHLAQNALSIEQTTPLSADGLVEEKRGNTTMTIERGPGARVYTLK
jgi:hypothetical protein